jgi:hypothetical protein
MRDLPDVPPVDDHEARLERALIEEDLRIRGTDLARVSALAPPAREALLHDASIYAATKLAEIEARAHYVEDLHQRE